MVDSVASECVTKYHHHSGSGKPDGTGSRRMSLRTLQKALTLDPEEDDIDEDDEDVAEGWSVRRPPGNAGAGNAGAGNGGAGNGGTGNGGAGNGGGRAGNNLPFGGVGQLAEPILRGQCIVEKLISNGYGYELISIMSRDEFFLPIPSWWLRPLLVYYKDFRENFENGRHV
ncbi:forkhead box protein D1-like [Penaeus monodon]|uniref:forkhead box protein D1-like n=1 Tax=Penaeus monodon TaxID=6687 RepID=UPI0018A7D4A9|nr:forkhead box protein D1-like [Penaeus monodon]